MTLSDDQVTKEVADINNEDIWPLWPILPMKLLGGPTDDRTGILWCSDKTRIYRLTLIDLKPNVPLEEQFKDVEVLEFESVEAMVREGWVGD